MGMERMVPTMEKLDVLVGLLCRSAVGQKLTSYVTVAGPIQEEEVDGPEEFHLVVVDNGRSQILGSNSVKYCNVFVVLLVLTYALYIVMLVDIHMVLYTQDQLVRY